MLPLADHRRRQALASYHVLSRAEIRTDMPFPEFEPTPPAAPETSLDVSQVSGAENSAFGAQQLSSPQDVTSASQFFQGASASPLPELTISDGGASSAMGTGAEQMMMHPTEAAMAQPMGQGMPGSGMEVASVAPGLPGAESAAMTLAPGPESAAMLNGVAPGAEPISPLIQLIMKMPGAMGVVNSIFEFLGAIFGGGNLIALFDPILWMQQASAAIASFTISFVEGLPAAIMNNTLSNNQWFASLTDHFRTSIVSTTQSQVSQVATQPLANGSLNVSGPVNLNKPIFENSDLIAQAPSNSPTMYGDWGPQNFYATNGGQQLMGNYSATPTVPATTTTPSIQHHAAPTQHAPATHHAPSAHHHHAPSTSHHARHHIDAAPRPEEIASASGTSHAGGEYMVQKGDSLWKIAEQQLGDGTRWGEIYQLNNGTIGGDPSLIRAGAQLKLPDAPNIAGGDGGHYIVQPGDNLWDISRQHLGDGSRWTEVYQNNQAVIGDNPNLIHPGQELSLPGGGDATTVASVDAPALSQTGTLHGHAPIHTPMAHQAPPITHHVTTAGHGPQLAQASPGHAASTHATVTVPAAHAPVHHAPSAGGLQAQQPVLDTGAGTQAQAPVGDAISPQAATAVPTSFAKSVNALGDSGVSTAGSPGTMDDPSGGIDPSYMNKQP
jgi:LysM repeat protein